MKKIFAGCKQSTSVLLLITFLLLFSGVAKAEKIWVLASSTNHWEARSMPGVVVFNSNVWLTGGTSASGILNDEWKSENGVDWSLVTADGPWNGRYGQQTIVFNDYIWFYGGKTGVWHMPQKDIWRSANGKDWNLINNNAPWYKRTGQQCLVYSNKVWLMGGDCGVDDITSATENTNDVWSSSDGYNWSIVTEAAPWKQRNSFSAVVFDEKMWVIGGENYSYETGYKRFTDVWSSTNGLDWTLVTDNAQWGERSSSKVVVYEDKMWLLGGYKYSGGPIWLNDIWTSTDGSNWVQETDSAPWMGRAGHSCIVKNDAIWLMGGYNNGNYGNGVWIYGAKSNIKIKGNGINITNGDSTPEITDGTDFDSALTFGNSVTQQFLIEAEGQNSLKSQISISNSSAFFVLSGKDSVTAPGTSSFFNIVFDPIDAGNTTGTVYILNNSSNAPIYTFEITGEGVASPPAIIELTGSTDFGEIYINGETTTNTFTIENKGGDYLNIFSASISNSSEFSINIMPEPQIAPESTSVFSIIFDPNFEGAATGTVFISNNSSNSATYIFEVTGKATPNPPAIIELTGSTDFGEIYINGETTTNTFTIENKGGDYLNIFSASISNSSEFSINIMPEPQIAPESISVFSIIFDPNFEGAATGTVFISNNSSNSATYIFEVTGKATPNPPAIIELTGSTDFGEIYINGETTTNTFTIENKGGDYLNIFSASISNSSEFSINIMPEPQIAPESISVFSIIFDPNFEGAATGTVYILNNSSNAPIYTFEITGEGVASSPAIIELTGSTDFGEIYINGETTTNTFTIENKGGDYLNIFSASISNSSEFSINIMPEPQIAPESTSVFSIIFDPNFEGAATGTVFISNNSSNSATYIFEVTGKATPNPPAIIELTGSTDFGEIYINGETTTNTFTIENKGGDYLNIFSASISNSSEFSINIMPEPQIAPESTSVFSIIFDPNFEGAATGTVFISNNSSNSATYIFEVTGKATPNPPAIIELTGSTDFGEIYINGETTTNTFTIENKGGDYLNIFSASISNSSEFSINIMPEPQIAPESTSVFSIIFDPNFEGAATGTVFISNNSTNNSNYTFEITGEGIPEPFLFINCYLLFIIYYRRKLIFIK